MWQVQTVRQAPTIAQERRLTEWPGLDAAAGESICAEDRRQQSFYSVPYSMGSCVLLGRCWSNLGDFP